MLSRFSALAIVLCFVGACTGDSSSAWQGTITDSAGVTIVQNPAEPLWGPDEAWTLTEELRIGTAEGEPEYQFGTLSGIAVASDGRIVTADAQAQQIRVFTPDGVYERTIGKPGAGPGELGLGIAAAIIGPGDTLLVPDAQNRRMNRFAPDGASIPSFPLDLAKGRPLRFAWNAPTHSSAARFSTCSRRRTFR